MLLALSGTLPLAASLIKDPGFDSDKFNELYYTYHANGAVKVERITEDMTWNKCLKMEVTQIHEVKGRKLLSCELIFGKNNGKPGFAAEPDTTYNFSFDFKGNVQVSLLVGLDPAGKPQWNHSKKIIRPNPRIAKPDPEKWSTVKGTFKTAADTKFLRFIVRFWADSKQQSVFNIKVGDFILLDNFRIAQRRSLDSTTAVKSPAASVPLKTVYPAKSSIKGKMTVLPSPWLKGTADVPVVISYSCRKNALVCKIVYENPDTAKHKYFKQPRPVSENGKKIWGDDVAEIFFSLDADNKSYHQFACSRNGGRCYIVNNKESGKLEQWSAKAVTANGKSEYTFTIPYSLIGSKDTLPAGTLIKFNVGIKHNGISYSFAPIHTSFNDVANFALLGLGNVEDFQKKAAAELKKDAPTAEMKAIEAFAARKFQTFAQVLQASEKLKNQIVSAKMGKAPFVLAQLPLHGNFSAPLEIGVENVVNDTIKLRAAGREIAMVPLVIVNRTGKTASYRVVIHDDAENFRFHENHTLAGGFPAENITLREGVAVKDSEGKKPGAIFDALPKINQAQTVTAAPGEGALVWVELDASGVQPGKYTGSVRIIPLAEPSEHTYKQYKGAICDYPITLEVLPFELPDPLPGWLCSNAGTVDHLKYMMQLAPGRVHISPFCVKHKFNSKGDLIDDNGSHERLVAAFKDGLEKYRQLDALNIKRKFLYGYSAYTCFTRTSMPKKMKELTPEWENCWRNHLKAIRKAILASGVSMDDVVFEIWDEPRGKNFKLLLRLTQIMRETLPDGVLSITWACENFEFTPQMMSQFDELLDEHIYHWLLRNSPKYKPLIKRMDNRRNTLIGIYQCSTGIREDLHTYYRLHAWRAFRMNCDLLGFYQFNSLPWGQSGATDWKRIPGGAIAYRAGNSCIPSIRFMAMRRGVDDIRYMNLLKKFSGNPGVDELLKTAPKQVEDAGFDGTMPDKIRDQAVKLILKYHK